MSKTMNISYTDVSNGVFNIPITLIQSTFPAGERYLRIPEETLSILNEVGIKQQATSFITVTPLNATADTIMDLLLFSDAIKQLGKSIKLILNCYYLPYSRQDRVCSQGESNSLAVFMGLLSTTYDIVSVMDVHNPRIYYGNSWELKLPNYREDFVSARSPSVYFKYSGNPNTCIVAVDEGAIERCKYACNALGVPTDNIIVFDKTRDNGKISHYLRTTIDNIEDIENFLVVDDICDGGATFISVLEKLKSISTKSKKFLMVTHGIFSKGLGVLKGFDGVYVHKNPYNWLILNKLSHTDYTQPC